ncbi:hypothetical protein D9M68_506250 [compost metagenome]
MRSPPDLAGSPAMPGSDFTLAGNWMVLPLTLGSSSGLGGSDLPQAASTSTHSATAQTEDSRAESAGKGERRVQDVRRNMRDK